MYPGAFFGGWLDWDSVSGSEMLGMYGCCSHIYVYVVPGCFALGVKSFELFVDRMCEVSIMRGSPDLRRICSGKGG